MKMLKTLLTIGIGIGFVIAVGFLCHWQGYQDHDCEQEYLRGYWEGYDYIKSIEELQEQVGAMPDGKICKMWNVPNHSETGEKWDKAVGQQTSEIWINDKTMGMEK